MLRYARQVLPPAPAQTDPCGPDNAYFAEGDVPASTDDYTVEVNEDATVITVTATPGNVFDEEGETELVFTAEDSGEPCRDEAALDPAPKQAWVLFNNDFSGFAIETVHEKDRPLQLLLGQETDQRLGLWIVEPDLLEAGGAHLRAGRRRSPHTVRADLAAANRLLSEAELSDGGGRLAPQAVSGKSAVCRSTRAAVASHDKNSLACRFAST